MATSLRAAKSGSDHASTQLHQLTLRAWNLPASRQKRALPVSGFDIARTIKPDDLRVKPGKGITKRKLDTEQSTSQIVEGFNLIIHGRLLLLQSSNTPRSYVFGCLHVPYTWVAIFVRCIVKKIE
jgi:hypothetical protein